MADATLEQADEVEENSSGSQEGSTQNNETKYVTTKKLELNAEFNSFMELRDAVNKYQRDNSVQLIVKDSKLLRAESTRRIIPKVYHLVNQSLLYHSITYCCKCHGELKQKPGTRMKNIGAKRLNCPMYLRLKLTSDLQRLVLFDMDESHNHGIDPTTFQMTPRQQVYRLSRMKRGQPEPEPEPEPTYQSSVGKEDQGDVGMLIASAIKDVNSVSFISSSDQEPPRKMYKVKEELGAANENEVITEQKDEDEDHVQESLNRPESPLDSEESFSDSDEEEREIKSRLLPFPIRLLGSAIQTCPELITASKQLIELQKSNLMLEKRKLVLQTRQLELENSKLELEVKVMEKNLAAELSVPVNGQDTTIYLQAS